MNCTIWRNTSISEPFSASSASAIVAVVIVISLKVRLVGRTSTLSGLTMATPNRWPDRAASRFGLRPSRLAARLKTYTTTRDISRRLEPRSAVTIYGHRPEPGPGHRLKCAYARAECGVTRTGTSPAFKQLARGQ